MLPTSAGVEPTTSWSPVGRRIQLSRRGRLPFLNQQKEKNDHRNYFMINIHKIYVGELGFELATSDWDLLSYCLLRILIVLGFNDTSTLEGHFVSSPREREKRDRRESRGDEREGQGRKRNRNESEETEEIKTFPLYPYPLQG